MTIGEKIKKRRMELGLSVDDIAKILNRNRATIYRYESDEIENLPLSILEPLSNALRTTPAALMGWEQEHKNRMYLARMDKNLSKEKLSEITGFNLEQINKIDNGDLTFINNMDELNRLMEVLNVHILYVLGIDASSEQINDESYVQLQIESNLPKLRVMRLKNEQHLINQYNKLNNLGKKEALKRVSELTLISKYTN